MHKSETQYLHDYYFYFEERCTQILYFTKLIYNFENLLFVNQRPIIYLLFSKISQGKSLLQEKIIARTNFYKHKKKCQLYFEER